MPFQPKVSEIICIDGKEYRFNPYPANTDSAFSITGKRATVYQLQDEQGELFALKVFSLAYRSPMIAEQAKQLASLQTIPGLEACKRRVIIPAEQVELVIAHPELRYAVLMPWLPGRPLEELLAEKDALTQEQRLMASKKLAETLAQMEAQGAVHGNLNPSNLLVDVNQTGGVSIHLVGLERMSFYTSGGEDFEAKSDRLTGAMLIAALLSGEIVKEDETSQEEIAEILDDEWGTPISDLFEQVLSNQTPAECPPFSAWVTSIAKREKRISRGNENLLLDIGKDLRKAQQELTYFEQYYLDLITNDIDVKVQNLESIDTNKKSPDLAEVGKKKDSKVIRFLSGWGGLILFFIMLGILIYEIPEVFLVGIGSGVEAVIALVWIWRIQRKQFTFSLGWLFGSAGLFLLLISKPVRYWFFDAFYPYGNLFCILLAFEVLICGYFLSIDKIKESFSFKKQIPPYIICVIAFIIIFIISESTYIFFFYTSLPLVYIFIFLIALYTKPLKTIKE